MKQYFVDAFTDQIFSGNPAAVVILQHSIDDELMLNMARENNLSETAFAIKEGKLGPNGESLYHLRWITPGGEIDLCGHATLATSFVIFNFIEPPPPGFSNGEKRIVSYKTRSGILTVTYENNVLELDFPAYDLKEVPVTPAMTDAIGVEPIEAYMGRDLLCVLKDEETIRNLKPDQSKVITLDGVLLSVTAPSSTDGIDCVSRTFAPKHDIVEDPVCGSAHCHIAPYWGRKLNKKKLIAYQASRRGGTLFCDISVDGRVKLGGKAVLVSISETCY